MLCIHHLQLLDISKGQARHPSLRLAKHLRRKINPDYAILGGIAGERDARADTDFENSASDPLGCGGLRPTPTPEYTAQHQIVHLRPALGRLPQTKSVQLC